MSPAVTRLSSDQLASEREKHRNTDCEKKCNHKRVHSHGRYRSESHSHTSKHRSSSRGHHPEDTPPTSPGSQKAVRDRSPDVRKYTDSGGKLCNGLCFDHTLDLYMNTPMNSYNSANFPFAIKGAEQ